MMVVVAVVVAVDYFDVTFEAFGPFPNAVDGVCIDRHFRQSHMTIRSQLCWDTMPSRQDREGDCRTNRGARGKGYYQKKIESVGKRFVSKWLKKNRSLANKNKNEDEAKK